MDINAINQGLAILRRKIDGRAALLKAYNDVTNDLSALPKNKENYQAILTLTEKQETLLVKLKENKKLRETYLKKIDEKAELLKTVHPATVEKITEMASSIAEKEQLLLRLSESITAVTELLNELGKLYRQGGKAKVGVLSYLLRKLSGQSGKHAHLQEAKMITANIRKLTRRYRKELGEIEITQLPELPLNSFLGVVDYYLDNPITKVAMDLQVRNLIQKSRSFEADLLKQLEQLEEKETILETKLKELKQARMEWVESFVD